MSWENLMTTNDKSRWTGGNSAKDVARVERWRALDDHGVSVGPAFDRIPDFADIPFLQESRATMKARKR